MATNRAYSTGRLGKILKAEIQSICETFLPTLPGYKKQNPRKIIRLWAEKEMHNLNRMQRAGVHCPEVVALKKHVLVMSFVGTGREAAAKLKDVQLSSSQMEAAQKQTKEMMRTMYKSAGGGTIIRRKAEAYGVQGGRRWPHAAHRA
jgi:hypothetical protein